MSKLVQCIPNFSEGRRPDVVSRIVEAIRCAAAVIIVDYSMDVDHNRAVVTFLGSPEDVGASMLAGAREAVESIDLTQHKGGHPRIGAVDVVPLVPIREMTMRDAVALSREVGRDIAEQLEVPVYFYENSALPGRLTNLADIRKGGFEALRERGLTGNRVPDLGPPHVHPTAGATVVGARGPLIAYNVNLASSDIAVARKIAASMRRARETGKELIGVKAIGVYLASRDIAQVSTNITQPDRTSIWNVYSFIEREARQMGVEVLESELIGALREEALIDAIRGAIKLPDLAEERVLDHWMRETG